MLPRDRVLGFIAEHGLQQVDQAEYDRLRLTLGVPDGCRDLVVDRSLLLESGFEELHGVSFTKGCFVGQENTARMNWRSKVNRRLVVVETDTPGPRTRVHYPELGLAVEHRRTDDLAGAIIPDWLAASLAQPRTA